MPKLKHTEEQIIAMLKRHEAGTKAGELCREYNISDATFYKWKAGAMLFLVETPQDSPRFLSSKIPCI